MDSFFSILLMAGIPLVFIGIGFGFYMFIRYVIVEYFGWQERFDSFFKIDKLNGFLFYLIMGLLGFILYSIGIYFPFYPYFSF